MSKGRNKALPAAKNRPASSRGSSKTSLSAIAPESQPSAMVNSAKLPAKSIYHNMVLGATVYCHQLKLFLPDAGSLSGSEYVSQMVAEMKPRDPLEQMLIAQALWCHCRSARLSAIANEQTETANVRVVNDACDRASNSFRKLMLALAEYRRPPRTESFTVVKQANVAQQQVVNNAQNQILARPNPSNELESTASALLPDSGGLGIPATSSVGTETVAVEHRTQDQDGKVPKPDERKETRGT